MKYGINIEGTTIKAVSRFSNDTVLAEFQEITEEQYNAYLSKLTAFSYWDSSTNDIKEDLETLNQAKINATKSTYLSKLRELSIEIDFTIRMGSATEDLEREFANIKAQYDML